MPNLVADEGEDENHGFTDYQACTLLKLPSESVSWLPFDGSIDLSDLFCTHYEYSNCDILIEAAEKCMMPPFLERTLETSDVLDSDSNLGTMTNSNDACFYLATHQEFDINCPSDDLQVSEWFNQQLLSRTSPDFPQAVSSSCPTLSPKETQGRKPITLVLDLDGKFSEHLLHLFLFGDFILMLFLFPSVDVIYIDVIIRTFYLFIYLILCSCLVSCERFKTNPISCLQKLLSTLHSNLVMMLISPFLLSWTCKLILYM